MSRSRYHTDRWGGKIYNCMNNYYVHEWLVFLLSLSMDYLSFSLWSFPYLIIIFIWCHQQLRRYTKGIIRTRAFLAVGACVFQNIMKMDCSTLEVGVWDKWWSLIRPSDDEAIEAVKIINESSSVWSKSSQIWVLIIRVWFLNWVWVSRVSLSNWTRELVSWIL